jgi:hypothetical protein
LGGTEQAGEQNEGEGLHHERDPLAGKQPGGVLHQKTLLRTVYK